MFALRFIIKAIAVELTFPKIILFLWTASKPGCFLVEEQF